MSNLLVLFITLFVIAIIVFTILSFVGCPMYPRPKFTCAECEQVIGAKYRLYGCKACKDEITGEALTCDVSRGTKDCYKNARKASNEQHDSKE